MERFFKEDKSVDFEGKSKSASQPGAQERIEHRTKQKKMFDSIRW